MTTLVIIVIVATFLFSMRNLLGTLIRLAVYSMIAYTIFSDVIPGWSDKAFAIALLSLPILINFGIKLVKTKLLRIE